jgi:hypothetical protein
MALHADKISFRRVAGYVASPGDLISFINLSALAANTAGNLNIWTSAGADKWQTCTKSLTLTTYAQTKHF